MRTAPCLYSNTLQLRHVLQIDQALRRYDARLDRLHQTLTAREKVAVIAALAKRLQRFLHRGRCVIGIDDCRIHSHPSLCDVHSLFLDSQYFVRRYVPPSTRRPTGRRGHAEARSSDAVRNRPKARVLSSRRYFAECAFLGQLEAFARAFSFISSGQPTLPGSCPPTTASSSAVSSPALRKPRMTWIGTEITSYCSRMTSLLALRSPEDGPAAA